MELLKELESELLKAHKDKVYRVGFVQGYVDATIRTYGDKEIKLSELLKILELI